MRNSSIAAKKIELHFYERNLSSTTLHMKSYLAITTSLAEEPLGPVDDLEKYQVRTS